MAFSELHRKPRLTQRQHQVLGDDQFPKILHPKQMTNQEQTSKLLWVKIPTEHANTLKDKAEALGISRADFMRIILINFITTQSTITINNNAK